MRTRAGFTLAEVLIALVIFALLAAAGTAVMATAVDTCTASFAQATGA